MYKKEAKNYYKSYYKLPKRVNIFGTIIILTTKVTVIKIEKFSVEEYLNKDRPYLGDLVNDLKPSDTWKIQLTKTINFISTKDDNDEDRAMHFKSDSIEIVSSDEADEVIKRLFDSLKNRYHNNLESMRGS